MTTIEGFSDASEMLRGGVYVLLLRGQPVFAGRAVSMLSRIAAHRNLVGKSVPDWLPIKGIRFDQVLVRYVQPDHIDRVLAETIELLQPIHNIWKPVPLSTLARA